MRIPAVVIGAGHAGLAVSHGLAERDVDHIVLERGQVANTWRTERWDSLRLLTPNWQSRLPGYADDRGDPHGFMSMPEVVEFVSTYARVIDAPVLTDTNVRSVSAFDGGYRIVTDTGRFECAAVVLATGGFNTPKLPQVATSLPPTIRSIAASSYRNPELLDPGAVLVVGAAATGVQIADEIQRSGRQVLLAVGEHVRLPRVYRGRDIFWWMDRTGRSDERYDEVDDVVRARNTSSPQLIGTPDRRSIDLNALRELGVRSLGKITAVADETAHFSGGLRNVCALADLKQNRMLGLIDEWIEESGTAGEFDSPHRPEPTIVDQHPPLTLDLAAERVETVIWATGFRPDYSWLDVPVLDRKGELRHYGGIVTDSPGLYCIGLNFLRRRKSSFIHGAADDAADIADHLVRHLRSIRERVPS